MDTVQAAWEQYRSQVIHPDAGEIQVNESRQAFYAGSMVLMALIKKATANGIKEGTSMAMLSFIEDELIGYANERGEELKG